MEIQLTLSLPRDALSVGVARRAASQSLRSVGFLDEDIAEAELAISEASSNVLLHSNDGDEYEIRIVIADATLVMEVIDAGMGFNGTELGHGEVSGTAESGRGIQLMRAMVDDVRFSFVPGQGSIVRMTKVLRYHEGSVVAHVLGRQAESEVGGVGRS